MEQHLGSINIDYRVGPLRYIISIYDMRFENHRVLSFYKSVRLRYTPYFDRLCCGCNSNTVSAMFKFRIRMYPSIDNLILNWDDQRN